MIIMMPLKMCVLPVKLSYCSERFIQPDVGDVKQPTYLVHLNIPTEPYRQAEQGTKVETAKKKKISKLKSFNPYNSRKISAGKTHKFKKFINKLTKISWK